MRERGAEASVSSIPIVAPPDAAFSCHRCNRCCRGSWTIGVTAEEVERLRRLYPGFDPVDGRAGERDGRSYLKLARRPDGACVFLDEDGCRIHKQHGEDAKPAICRRFPYALTSFGASTFLHLSRVCPSVYAGRGERGDALLASALRAAGIEGRDEERADPESVALAGTRRLAYADYRDLEARLVQLLSDDRWPLDDAMAAGLVLIRRWAQDPEAARQRPRDENEPMELVLEAIARREPMMGLHRYVLATVVTVMESRRAGRAWSPEALADGRRYLRLLMARGREFLGGRTNEAGPVEVELARVGTIPWPRRNAPSLEPVRSLFASHLGRKILLTSAPDVEFGWHLLLVVYAVLKFYARSLAVASRRESLIPSDIEGAVRAVEFHLLLHPQGLPPLHRKLLGAWFRRFLFHPAFPSSMTCL